MTMPRRQSGRTAGSQACGIAQSSDYAWNANFNNGNVNRNNRNNRGRALAVCRPLASRECQGVTYKELYQALKKARAGKMASLNQAAFDAHWMTNLIDLKRAINDGEWTPKKTTCFIATRPKTREIHAPDFSDRVVHHWLIPWLDAIYEPTFIFDSYANRKGKGSHKAVQRLRTFVRSVYSGQGGGWYLQLDIRNYFNAIHRPTLYKMLKARMVKHDVPEHVRRVVHALLRQSATAKGVIHCSKPADRARIPPHKRLENAAPGCGLPVGNLTSQFFANVYLDKFDQFVKRELKVTRYVRYVDDFVLVHRDRAVLERWLEQIRAFLRDELKLELKADIRLRPLASGIDFLGYVIYPTHTRVRRRVLNHTHEALHIWQSQHLNGNVASATPAEYRKLQSVWASYLGHMRHADSYRLQEQIMARQPWVRTLTTTKRRFSLQLEGQRIHIRVRST